MLRKVIGTVFFGTFISGQALGQERFDAGATSRAGEVGSGAVPADDSSFSFEGTYKADHLRVVDGGLRRGGATMGHLDLKFTADLDNSLGWSGTTAFVNFLHDHGDKINADHVGSLLGVSNIEVPVDTHRFFQVWLQKNWNDDRFSLLAGLYPIDSEFQVIESAALFLQPPYGPTAEVSLTRGPSIFNSTSVGIRAKWLSDDRDLYVQAAVLDGIPGDPAHLKGTHVKFAKGDGTMSIAELGHHSADARTEATGAADGAAKYALGYWQYSAKVDDLVDIDANGNPVQRRSHGAYALAERSLWRGAHEFDLTGFLRLSATDGYSTAIRSTISAGLTINAPFASRGEDTVGIAYTQARMGYRFKAAQQAAGVVATSYESAWELTYRFQASSWLAIQPSFQHFKNPGADAAVSSASVAGARVELAF